MLGFFWLNRNDDVLYNSRGVLYALHPVFGGMVVLAFFYLTPIGRIIFHLPTPETLVMNYLFPIVAAPLVIYPMFATEVWFDEAGRRLMNVLLFCLGGLVVQLVVCSFKWRPDKEGFAHLQEVQAIVTESPLMFFILAFYLPQVFLVGYMLYPGQALFERGIPCVLLMLLCSLLYGRVGITAYLKYLAIQLGAALLFYAIWIPLLELSENLLFWSIAFSVALLPFVCVLREKDRRFEYLLTLCWPFAYPLFFVISWLSALRRSMRLPLPESSLLLGFVCYLLLTLLPYALGRLAKRKLQPL